MQNCRRGETDRLNEQRNEKRTSKNKKRKNEKHSKRAKKAVMAFRNEDIHIFSWQQSQVCSWKSSPQYYVIAWHQMPDSALHKVRTQSIDLNRYRNFFTDKKKKKTDTNPSTRCTYGKNRFNLLNSCYFDTFSRIFLLYLLHSISKNLKGKKTQTENQIDFLS